MGAFWADLLAGDNNPRIAAEPAFGRAFSMISKTFNPTVTVLRGQVSDPAGGDWSLLTIQVQNRSKK